MLEARKQPKNFGTRRLNMMLVVLANEIIVRGQTDATRAKVIIKNRLD